MYDPPGHPISLRRWFKYRSFDYEVGICGRYIYGVKTIILFEKHNLHLPQKTCQRVFPVCPAFGYQTAVGEYGYPGNAFVGATINNAAGYLIS